MGCTCWRHCELLPEALPGVKQIFQYRTLEDVIGSFQVAIEAGTLSASMQSAQQKGLDGSMREFYNSPVVPCMQRMVKTMREELELPWTPLHQKGQEGMVDLDVQKFVAQGSLGYQALRNIFSAHLSVFLGRKGLWSCVLRYEDLMERKSECIADMLRELGWLHLIPTQHVLGTHEGDQVFARDAHGGGGFSKAGGSTLGGDARHLQSVRNQPQDARENAHLTASRADIVRELMAQHEPLQTIGYDLYRAVGQLSCNKACTAPLQLAGELRQPLQEK